MAIAGDRRSIQNSKQRTVKQRVGGCFTCRQRANLQLVVARGQHFALRPIDSLLSQAMIAAARPPQQLPRLETRRGLSSAPPRIRASHAKYLSTASSAKRDVNTRRGFANPVASRSPLSAWSPASLSNHQAAILGGAVLHQQRFFAQAYQRPISAHPASLSANLSTSLSSSSRSEDKHPLDSAAAYAGLAGFADANNRRRSGRAGRPDACGSLVR